MQMDVPRSSGSTNIHLHWKTLEEKLCMLHSRICILLSARFVGLQHEAWGMRQTPCNGFLINFCQSPVRANQASCLGQIMRIDLQQISKVHKANREGSKAGREGCWAWFQSQSVTLSFDCFECTLHNMHLASLLTLIFNYDKSPSAAQNFIAHWQGEKGGGDGRVPPTAGEHFRQRD